MSNNSLNSGIELKIQENVLTINIKNVRIFCNYIYNQP